MLVRVGSGVLGGLAVAAVTLSIDVTASRVSRVEEAAYLSITTTDAVEQMDHDVRGYVELLHDELVAIGEAIGLLEDEVRRLGAD